ncbi:MAG: glycoside hydrolase family 16 protein [Terriglobales bacterium]
MTFLRFQVAFVLVIFILVIGCVPLNSHQQPSSTSSVSKPNWVLIWSDDFNGRSGSAPDSSKWVVENGGGGWGNKELEYYTDRSKNVRQENGNLVIEAIKEKFTGPDGVVRNYTSARVKSQEHFSQKYGRFEARIKVPHGRGLWPAFWLLGDDFSSVGWPACGEIDIMENGGAEPATIHGSLHGPGYSAENALTGAFTFPNERVADDFHVFAIEWEAERVRFYVDGELYATKTPADLPAGKHWVFDHPFFIILNLAVGGNLPGSPEDSTTFPQRMLVDFVHVYAPR